MLGLMGFSGSLPLYVIHRYYMSLFINWANKDACLLAYGTELYHHAKNTLCLRKVSRLMFVNNFGKCGLIFKILLPTDSQEDCLFAHRKHYHLTCSMLLRYLVKYRKSNNVTDFRSILSKLLMFLRTL